MKEYYGDLKAEDIRKALSDCKAATEVIRALAKITPHCGDAGFRCLSVDELEYIADVLEAE